MIEIRSAQNIGVRTDRAPTWLTELTRSGLRNLDDYHRGFGPRLAPDDGTAPPDLSRLR